MLLIFFPSVPLMEELGNDGAGVPGSPLWVLPCTGGSPGLRVVCLLGVLLQGSSREEPCQASALRSWPRSVRSRTRSCGSPPARSRAEMAAGLPSARDPEAPPLWTEGGRLGPGPGQQAMSRPRACLKTRASRQQMTLVEGSRRRLPRATASPRCCTRVPWDPQFTSLFQVLGCSCLLERLPDAGAQPLPPSAPRALV